MDFELYKQKTGLLRNTRSLEFAVPSRALFALAFIAYMLRDFRHPQVRVPQRLRRLVNPRLPQKYGEIFPEHAPEVVFQAGFAHLKPLCQLLRRVVSALIGAQDIPGFPGKGHMGAGEVKQRAGASQP